MTDNDCKTTRGINPICDERFAHISDQLDRILTLLEGNGNIGLKVRVDRLEQRSKLAQWVITTFAAGLLAFAGWLLKVYEQVH